MRLLNTDQIIELVNASSEQLGFHLFELADKIKGYQICAGFEDVASGHSVIVIFFKEVFYVSRLYDREEIAQTIKVLSAIYSNIKSGGDNSALQVTSAGDMIIE